MKLYSNPTQLLLEMGSLAQLPSLLQRCGAKNFLLLTGEKSFRSSIYYAELKAALSPFHGVEALPVPKEPKLSFLPDFLNAYRKSSIDTVIAVGGGSVLDVGKLAALLLAQDDAEYRRCLKDLETNREFKRPGLPLIAVPTTAGTGSEVTPYASFDTPERKKISITHDFLYPTYAVVDSRLTLSMPSSVTASTGFDALSQAIESFWSVRHNPTSDIHALRAIPLIIQSLKRAVDHSGDLEARSSMALAATEAGLAIAHTATTAVHSVSYPITTYFGVPHGHACALTLSSFIDFNQDAFPEGREKVLWNALQCKNAREASEKVDALMTGTGLERRLSRLGIDKPGIETIVKNGFRPDRVKNNPRELTQAELEKILLRIF